MQSREIRHPFEPDLSFLYGAIVCGPPLTAGAHSRNVCIFADGEVDRSPTGTGMSGRVALEYARGRLAREAGLRLSELHFVGDPTYLAFNNRLFDLAAIAEKLLPGAMRVHLVGVMTLSHSSVAPQ